MEVEKGMSCPRDAVVICEGVHCAQAGRKGTGSLIHHPIPKLSQRLCRECAAPQLPDRNNQICCSTKEILAHRLGEDLFLGTGDASGDL